MNIRLEITGITEENKSDKFQKAIKAVSEQLKIPATIEHKENHKEKFPYQAQEDLYQMNIQKVGLIMDDLYSRVCSTLGMRPSSTFRKAIDPKAPKLGKGEILWNPETGQPITQKDLDKLLKEVDKFLNRNIGPLKKEFTISQSSIARMIAALRKNNSYEKIKDRPLDKIKYDQKTFEYFDTYQKLNDVFPANYERLKFRERVVGNYITSVNDDTRDGIRNILDEGFMAGKSKGEISQDLFYKFGSLNKDWDRIIDTEAANIFNSEYINEQRSSVQAGEPLYFIRREFLDNKTCSFCEGANEPVIAKWSETPLQDENIKDPVANIALWSGKSNMGRSRADWWWAEAGIHPNCRGKWERYFPEIGDIDLSI